MDDIDVGIRAKFFVILGDDGIFRAVLLRQFLSALDDDVAECNDFDVIEIAECGEMFLSCDTAAADDTDFEFLACALGL